MSNDIDSELKKLKEGLAFFNKEVNPVGNHADKTLRDLEEAQRVLEDEILETYRFALKEEIRTGNILVSRPAELFEEVLNNRKSGTRFNRIAAFDLNTNNIDQFMLFLLPRDRRDDIMGDLEEDYRTNIIPKLGLSKAKWWYWFQAIRTIWQYNGLTARIIRLVEGIRNSGK